MTDLYKKLANAVVNMKRSDVIHLANQVIDRGLPAEEAIQKGLAGGMAEVGRLFAENEYFVPEVLVCAKCMYAGFDLLQPKVLEGRMQNKATIVIGVVQGDFHDIGKNIVKLMLQASGFRLVDLGNNVAPEKFIEAAKQENARIIALSTLMTTTMDDMEQTVKLIRQKTPEIKTMIGGAPVHADFARACGAAFYGGDANAAVAGAHQLLNLNYEDRTV